MRDAFGGTFTIQILLVFIIIYVGFIGIAINYGRAFRIKNSIIDFLEENQIINLAQTSNGENVVEKGIKEILNNANYNNSAVCKNFTNTTTKKCVNGVIIQQNFIDKKNGVTHVYYTVNTYIGYNLGFLNSLLSLTRDKDKSQKSIAGYFRISGETKVLVTG